MKFFNGLKKVFVSILLAIVGFIGAVFALPFIILFTLIDIPCVFVESYLKEE